MLVISYLLSSALNSQFSLLLIRLSNEGPLNCISFYLTKRSKKLILQDLWQEYQNRSEHHLTVFCINCATKACYDYIKIALHIPSTSLLTTPIYSLSEWKKNNRTLRPRLSSKEIFTLNFKGGKLHSNLEGIPIVFFLPSECTLYYSAV